MKSGAARTVIAWRRQGFWVAALLLLLASFLVAPGGSPGPRARISLVTTAWSLLAVVCLLWPGFGTPAPDDALPAGFEGDRTGFELLVLGPLAALFLACCACYQLGGRRAAAVEAG